MRGGAPAASMGTMIPFTVPDKTAPDALLDLEELCEERALALASPLEPGLLAELDAMIEERRQEYVGLAVTELATLRGELGGTLQG
jgi:hypothetical protein